MDEAIASLRRDLSPEHQDAVARFRDGVEGTRGGALRPHPRKRADLDAAGAEIARGAVASDEEVRALWAKHGLKPVHTSSSLHRIGVLVT